MIRKDRMKNQTLVSRLAWTAIPLLTAIGFLEDIYTRKGVDDWVWYIVALLLTLIARGRNLPLWLAGVFSGLTLLGFRFSPPGVEPDLAFFNCIMGIGVMWAMALVIWLRQKDEFKIRESEERFRQIFELASVGMGQADPETGRWLCVNNRMCAITGYSPGEMLERRVPEITHPEDRERDWQLFQSVIRGDKPHYRNEKRYVRKDGGIVWVNVNMTVIRNPEGIALRTMATIEDITERRENEEKIRKLSRAVEQSPVSVIITDRKGRIEYVNPKLCKITGYAMEELIGETPRIFKSGETTNTAYKELWKAIIGGKEWRGEFHNRRKNGELFWESAAISPIFDHEGKISHFLAVKEDITERKQLEAQFLRAQRLESIGALASGIAHDLNNILAPVLMSAPLLRGAMPKANDRELVDMIETSAQRGTGIIKQLLTFARGEPGARAPLPLRHLLEDMQKIVAETFPRNIQAKVQTAANLWPIMGDATQVHQVLLNLCVNARDAMPNGGAIALRAINVTLDTGSTVGCIDARPGNYVCLSVEDTGTGIPPEIVDRIFDPFFTTKEIGQGTGLGLATVSGIVRGHGGFICVKSKVNEGAAFQLYLPASRQTVNETAPSEPLPAGRGDGELILIVDDEPAVRESVQRTLESSGYRVITAAHGTEGMAIFSERQVDLRAILTDMMMPSKNGPELVRFVRSVNPKLPILGMTGLPDRKGVNGMDHLELETMLIKPFASDQLLNALQTALHPLIEIEHADAAH